MVLLKRLGCGTCVLGSYFMIGGFVELRCARAVFTLRCNKRLIAVLTLHVDDGMLFGLEKHPSV